MRSWKPRPSTWGIQPHSKQKSDWMELEVEALLRESQLAREAVQLKQTLELGNMCAGK